MVPVDVLDFVPGEFGLEAAVCEGNDPEALLGVVLQNLCKVRWYWRDTQRGARNYIHAGKYSSQEAYEGKADKKKHQPDKSEKRNKKRQFL